MSPKSSKIMLLDPVGETGIAVTGPTPRVDKLDNKAVGFLFNGHHSAGVLFQSMKEGLEKRCHFSEVLYKAKPNVCAPAPPEFLEELAAKSDLVVLGVGA